MRLSAHFMISVLLLGISGCQSNVRVEVPFRDAAGLTSDASVYLEQTEVGRVEAITEVPSGVRVTLGLTAEGAKSIRANAAAMIMHRDGERYVQIFNSGTGDPIGSGQTLNGLDTAVDYLAWQAGDAVDRTGAGLAAAANSLHEYLESDAWKNRKQEMQQELERLDRSFDELGEQAQRDFQDFAEQLERESEQAMERYEALSEELQQAIIELNRRGQKELAESLRLLLDDLKALLDRYAPTEEQRRIGHTNQT